MGSFLTVSVRSVAALRTSGEPPLAIGILGPARASIRAAINHKHIVVGVWNLHELCFRMKS